MGNSAVNLFHVVFQLFPERCVDRHPDRSREHDQDEHDEEGDEADVDGQTNGVQDAEHDAHHDAEYQRHEKHRPLAAVRRVVRRLDGLHRFFALAEQEIERKRP